MQNIHLTPNLEFNDIYEGIGAIWNDVNLDEISDDRKKLKSWTKIKCLSENSNSGLMWAHYANDYSGICVEYDLSRLSESNIALNTLYPVCYSTTRSLCFDMEEMVRYLNGEEDGGDWIADTKHLFLQKAHYWDYEKEWRIIQYSRDLKEDSISFPCISKIFFGPKVNEVEREGLIEKVVQERDMHIDLYDMQIDNDTYELQPKKIVL